MFWEPNLLTALQKLTALSGRRLEMAVQLEFLSLQIRLTLLVLMLQNLTAAWAVYLSSGSQLFKPSDCTVWFRIWKTQLWERNQAAERGRKLLGSWVWLHDHAVQFPPYTKIVLAALLAFCHAVLSRNRCIQVFMVITAIKTKTLLTALHATISCLLWINTICSLVYCKLAMICSHQSQLWSLKYQAVTRLFGAVVSMINKNMWTCHSILV